MGLIELAGGMFPRLEDDEFVILVPCGNLGSVELTRDGKGMILTVEQIGKLKEEGGLKGLSLKRQEDGKYLVNVREYQPGKE